MSKARQLADFQGDASALTTGTLPVDRVPYIGRRNLIINGAMQVAQRGTSVSNVSSSGYYTIDRFGYWQSDAGTATVSQSSDAPTGFSTSFKVEMTTANASLDAGDYQQIRAKIEAQDLQVLDYGSSSARTATMSFWVKSSITGTYSVGFWQDDSAQRYTRNFTIDSANTWEKKTVLITGNTANGINNDNGVGFEVNIIISAGSTFTNGTTVGSWHSGNTSMAANQTAQISTTNGATFYLTGVQLEVGSVATPFEHRSYGEELALCQRYYWRMNHPDLIFNMSTWGGNAVYGAVHYPQEMRATPSLQVSNISDSISLYQNSNNSGRYSTLGTSQLGTKSARLEGSSGTASFNAGLSGWIQSNIEGAYIAFDAEL